MPGTCFNLRCYKFTIASRTVECHKNGTKIQVYLLPAPFLTSEHHYEVLKVEVSISHMLGDNLASIVNEDLSLVTAHFFSLL